MQKLLTFLLLCCTSCLWAQKTKSNGWIINLNGDTVRGYIKLGMPAVNSLKIQFRAENETALQSYVPFGLKKWKLDADEFPYESKYYSYTEKGETYGVFMKKIVHGDVSYYEYFNSSTDMGFNEAYLERNNKLTLIQTNKFYPQLAEYFKDNEELAEQIKQKKFKKRQLAQIVKLHNEWLEKRWN